MKVLKKIEEYKSWRRSISKDKVIGFVPTMGSLHEGHASLIKTCKESSDHSVVSIFVNSLQFNNAKDFLNYPKDLDADVKYCESLGVDVVFAPEHSSFYPPDFYTYVEVQQLDKYLCGLTRPGHFQGVCTVVLKLFNNIEPHKAFFGKKDYQQFRIIKKMTEDLSLKIEIIPVEIIRERSGLAMSSRNKRLSEQQLERAEYIYKGLSAALDAYIQGNKDGSYLEGLVKEHLKIIAEDRINYISVASKKHLQPVDEINEPCILAVAVFYGDVRLIDNVELG